jgi:hypothetical protein
MDEKAYEQYVARVVRNMSFSDKAKVYTNRRYPGIRQPGSYEIDVACELWFDDSLFFLIIVECKNWNRPVDRPEVQKLIQTRDAITAHKAAFASPVGYTKEAIQVAKANGVALWTLAEGIFGVAAGSGLAALSLCFRMSESLRTLVYESINYNFAYRSNLRDCINPNDGEPNLVPISWLSSAQNPASFYPIYGAVSPYESAFDPIVSELIRFAQAANSDSNSFTRAWNDRVSLFREILQNAGLGAKQSIAFLEEFVVPMVTDGISVPQLFDRLNTFDSSVRHGDTELQAPLTWIEGHGREYFIYSTDENDDSFLSLKSNIVWGNAAWLFSRIEQPEQIHDKPSK